MLLRLQSRRIKLSDVRVYSWQGFTGMFGVGKPFLLGPLFSFPFFWPFFPESIVKGGLTTEVVLALYNSIV